MKPKAINLNQRIQQRMANPFEALNEGTSHIFKALKALEISHGKPAMVLQHEKNLADLKAAVTATIEFVQFAILSYAKDGTGFHTDPSGLLTGKSTFESETTKKQFQYAYLVSEYASEFIQKASLTPNPDTPDCPISDTQAAILLTSPESESSVTTTLTDGSKVIFNKDTSEIGLIDPTDSSKVSWIKSKFDLTKDWFYGIWCILKDWGIMVKDWVVGRYHSAVSFFYGSDKDDTVDQKV